MPVSDRKTQPVDVLMISERSLWPLDEDFRAVGCRVARELARNGLRVAMSSLEPTVKAQAWLAEMLVAWPGSGRAEVEGLLSGWRGPLKDLRHILAKRDGLAIARLAGAVGLVQRYQPAVVIGLGDRAPALLRGIKGADPTVQTVWLAHHDPTLVQLSILRDADKAARGQALSNAMTTLTHELAFGGIDAVVGGSSRDVAALRLLTRAGSGIALPRGVNLDRYRPGDEPIRPQTAITWARLDDADTARALLRFGQEVWPRLIDHFPSAQWRLMGPSPHKLLQPLLKLEGVKIYPPLPDLRQRAHRTRVALLPLRCATHSHKMLLEAAAMGMAVATTPAAARHAGLSGNGCGTVATAGSDADWLKVMTKLWTDPTHAKALANNARVWALTRADWETNTAALRRFIAQCVAQSRVSQDKQPQKSQATSKSVESRSAHQPIADDVSHAKSRRSGYRKAA